ncbi:cysteine desulfurase family protein [Sandaracinobacteroides saxicola]|nr:aminotransferase class V-fold PLP-dependent enzyme [Sandaracinobacteroides saxicola]
MADAAARLACGEWANPSSVHAPGRAARRAMEAARGRIAGFFRVPADSLLFTSGGTEALVLALGNANGAAVAVMATEHNAVLGNARGATVLPVDVDGRLEMDALAAFLAANPGGLVAVQDANNETGVVQASGAIAEAVHAAGGRLLCDAVQSAGKRPLPPADFVALSAHKLGGPAGVGALVVRCRDGVGAMVRGSQEGGLRGGTENLIGVIGWAAALEALPDGWLARCEGVQARLESVVLAEGGRVNGAGVERLPTISSVHLAGVAASTQLMRMDMAGIAVSQGAACSSGTMGPSATLLAMGAGEAARESLRVSFGWGTTDGDVDRFIDAWRGMRR